jgi:fructose-specific phosphotransferase system component IIB
MIAVEKQAIRGISRKINEMNIARSKLAVVLSKNTISMKNKKYILDENNLIILNQNNQI